MPEVPDLERELRDVEPESFPAHDDQFDLAPDTDDVDPADGTDNNTSDGKDGKDERDLNNIHREFDRKYRRLESRLSEVLDRLETAGEKVPSKPSGNQLDDMSIDQLKSIRSEVPDDRKDDFDAYLTQRIVEETVEKRVSVLTERQNQDLKRVAANQQAVDRYPDLKDPDSDFRYAVQKTLNELGSDYVKANPRAILDAANEVALNMGIRARTQSIRRPAATPATRNQTPGPGNTQKPTLSREKAEQLARNLKHAMPNKQFDIDKIMADHADYSSARAMYVRG